MSSRYLVGTDIFAANTVEAAAERMYAELRTMHYAACRMHYDHGMPRAGILHREEGSNEPSLTGSLASAMRQLEHLFPHLFPSMPGDE